MNKLKLVLFYILSFTWGIIMSLLGSIVILFLIIIGKKPHLFHGRVYIQVGKDWGGCEMGCFFICDDTPTLSLKQHECGHGIQNIILGPLTPFIVSIPSGLRYQLRERASYKGKYIFDTIVTLIFVAISSTVFALGIVFNNFIVLIIGDALLFYTIVIALWLFMIETPRYKTSPWPDYDEIHFEGGATRIGKALFPDEQTTGSMPFKEILKNL